MPKEVLLMVQFLNATQTFGEIQSIINQATNRSSIVMISPFIKVNDLILMRLIDAGKNRNVKITMVCRGENLNSEERMRLEQIPNLNLVWDEHVHAKCFYNDESMVIGSLNLYQSAAGINHEMGVLLHSDYESDREAFISAKNEAQFIIRNAQPQCQNKVESIDLKTIGHCIHCGNEITFNVDAPYCNKCWKNWNRYKNRDFSEGICHSCGRDSNTSMNKPLCFSCEH
jgi:PLD-like domain